jgi:hypothetical protein
LDQTLKNGTYVSRNRCLGMISPCDCCSVGATHCNRVGRHLTWLYDPIADNGTSFDPTGDHTRNAHGRLKARVEGPSEPMGVKWNLSMCSCDISLVTSKYGIWQQVALTDPERTALDLIARSDVFGGMGAAFDLLEEILPRINIINLIQYGLQYDTGAVIKRLGWVLEQLSATEEMLSPLQNYGVNISVRSQNHE